MLDRKRFESLCEQHMELQFKRVPKMRELHDGEWTDREYYVRHMVETVLRIRLDFEVATYALSRVGSSDHALAGAMSKYLHEEFGHVNMFLRDLDRFGVTSADVYAIPEFPATAKLMGYLHLLAQREGPAPTTVWDWFVEWYQDRYNAKIVGRAAKEFGAEEVKGWLKHIDFDETHDHDDLTWGVVSRAVTNWSTPERAEIYLAHYIEMIGDYFQELYDATVGAPERAGQPERPGVVPLRPEPAAV